MAFTVPEFPITCDIYTGPWTGRVLRIAGQECNLAFGRRVQTLNAPVNFQDCPPIAMDLLLPPGVDVRDQRCGPINDLVECPSGTGRWYLVNGVDDIGKGFPNEHRCAILMAIFQDVDGAGTYPGLFWPTPIP